MLATRARLQPAKRNPLEDAMPSGRFDRDTPISMLTPPCNTVSPRTNDSGIPSRTEEKRRRDDEQRTRLEGLFDEIVGNRAEQQAGARSHDHRIHSRAGTRNVSEDSAGATYRTLPLPTGTPGTLCKSSCDGESPARYVFSRIPIRGKPGTYGNSAYIS